MLVKEVQPYAFLKFHVDILKFVRLWPREKEKEESKFTFLQNYFLIIILIPTSIPLVADVISVMYERDADISLMIQPLLATVCTMGQHYILLCFLSNKHGIKKLIESIGNLSKFSPLSKMIEADKQAVFFSKIFMLYSAIGAIVYSCMPLISLKDCEAMRTIAMKERGVPCGLVCRVRLPFKIDYSPMYELTLLHQMLLVFCVSWFVSLLTMFLFGIVYQARHHMKMLRAMLLELSDYDGDEIKERVVFIITYHIAIIDFCDDLNETFSSQMFMHITLTSVVISILGFELMMANLFDVVRFSLHLLGWLCLLLLVCYTGQTLIDESIGVARDAYNSKWYNFPVGVQKDIKMIIMRAQKPIMLKAMYGVLSLPSFLNVLSTAYSYMTLLFNMK